MRQFKLKPKEVEAVAENIETASLCVFRPTHHQEFIDPLTGREIILNPARSQRKFEVKEKRDQLLSVEDCNYCQFRTTPTIFFVDSQGQVVVPNNGSVNKSAVSFLAQRRQEDPDFAKKISTYYDLVRILEKENRKVVTDGNWLSRVFHNIAPTLVGDDLLETCFMIGVNPKYHFSEFDDAPIEVITAMVKAWQALEYVQLAKRPKGVTVPFVNGGKSTLSGQSIVCLHGQAYIYRRKPVVYEDMIRRQRLFGHCPICGPEMRVPELKVRQNGNSANAFRLSVHPYPEYNLTLLATPVAHVGRLIDVSAMHLADALQQGISILTKLLGQLPPYNILVRTGVDHFHCEIFPRIGVNIHAGCEKTTQSIIVTQDPADVAQTIRDILAS